MSVSKSVKLRRDTLPKGFSLPLSFYAVLPGLPPGVKETLQGIITYTWGRRAVCPLSIKALAGILGKRRETVSLHIAFLADLGQVRFQQVKRGDSRSRQIVLCFREKKGDLKEVSEQQIAELPDKAIVKRTLQAFKEERRSRPKKVERPAKNEQERAWLAQVRARRVQSG